MGLTNTQYDTLMRIYSRRQSENMASLEARRRDAYERIPQLRELDEIQAGSAAALARLAATSGEADAQAFLEQAQTLSRIRLQLLEENGYPQDYLSMRYTCPDCQDTGYIGAQPCHCFRQEAAALLYTQTGLAGLGAEDGFARFSLSCYPEDLKDPATGLSARASMRHVLEVCQSFTASFATRRDSLFFYGNTGLGKTLLSRCIAAELAGQGHSVLYFGAHELFEALARSTFSREEKEGVDLDFLGGCDLLIIDDLGTELSNAFVTSRLFLILDERIRQGKSTILSTNLSLPVFADTYSERTFSRIMSSFVVLRFFGNDVRLQKKLAEGDQT